MTIVEAVFDDILVDLDDEDRQLEKNYISCVFPEQGGRGGGISLESMPDSVGCLSIVNSRSTTGLNCGPNPNTTSIASNWVLGVRHLSIGSNSLNKRMAERAKHLPSYVSNHSNFKLKSSICVQKNDSKLSSKYPMNDIQEDSIEVFDTYRSHKINSNVIQNKKGFGLIMKERVDSHRSCARQLNTGNNSSKQKCGKPGSYPNLHKDIDRSNTKLNANPSVNETLPKIDYPDEDNQIKEFSKGINNCDSKTNDSNLDQNMEIIFQQINATNSDQNNLKNFGINYKRSVNLVTLSAEQEQQRYKSQRFCELVSLITIIFGLILVTITPFLLIPIWVIPNPYSPLIRNFLWASMLTTVLLMTLAALTGNIYWYYDQKSQKWKWFYHCGKGPEDHYWGTSLFRNNILKPLAKRIRKNTNNNTLNV